MRIAHRPVATFPGYLRAAIAAGAGLLWCGHALAAATCAAERDAPLVPTDPALCVSLEQVVRKPEALPLNEYEAKLAEFLRNFCHRNEAAGWTPDKRMRDTGPFIGTFQNGKWSGDYHGTHAPVVVWYSPDMVQWLKGNRPETQAAVSNPAPVPDGAIMVKEMYPPPISACAKADLLRLFPLNGGAVMVRSAGASYDGWFWGWFGWKENSWAPSWPAQADNPYPNMGFGLYCTNCHSSARDNQTFVSLRNIAGEPGEPLVFLSHDFFLSGDFAAQGQAGARSGAPPAPFLTHHEEIAEKAKTQRGVRLERPYRPEFTELYQPLGGVLPFSVGFLPSETYDHVWAPGGEPSPTSQFVTSDQCIGCHGAGGTGLQFQMTEAGAGATFVNISPHGTWRHSPMGLSGRDPIFFAQLASETETFHPESSALIQDTCLSCHAVQGQRQHAIDSQAANGQCDAFAREMLAAIPYEADDRVAKLAHYAGLGRDGVSCNTCHAMVVGEKDRAKVEGEPQNACLAERQERINPGLTGLARTFTGNFLLASPGKIFGPFEDLKDKPMTNATGLVPEHSQKVKSSELCASCHTVHLPVLHRGQVVGRVYEQATYPEWAFSAYRSVETPDDPLPLGAGDRASSCQSCHMPSKNSRGQPYRSKIATIQEYTNFPQAEYTLPPEDIDLPEREGYAKHSLVGLNLFLIKMAQQFPQVLGIRTEDPMLARKSAATGLETAENAILEQAAERTAKISIDKVMRDDAALSATVRIENKAGHKFPSGVAFRRAFIEFNVLDADDRLLWSSGRPDGNGVIVDDNGTAVAGEQWWTADCAQRIEPAARLHQPHYQVITRQNQAQIYEELAAEPADGPAPVCGANATPEGKLTTSFLSICAKVKDNRLLPQGFLPLADRVRIAEALGAKPDLAEEVAPVGVDEDPDYRDGGKDEIVYQVKLAELSGKPALVRATLYYQAAPPYYLQDRFCTSRSEDSGRLYYLAGKLDIAAGPIKDWKLKVGKSAQAPVP
jgi:hypothetical protein